MDGGYHSEIINGKVETLAPNEALEEEIKCPECGGDLITSYGPGVAITFCNRCGYNDTDYF